MDINKMEQNRGSFTINQTSGGLVVSPQGAISESEIQLIQEQVLSRLHQNSYRFVIFNLAGVNLIDGTEFIALKKVLDMCQLMGATPILTDIHFGIASALVQLNFNFDQLITYRSVDQAVEAMN